MLKIFGVEPPMRVDQLRLPETTCPRASTHGATSLKRGDWRKASASFSVSLIFPPAPEQMPPKFEAEGSICSIFVPIELILSETAFAAPEPIAVRVITDPTPII